MQTSILLPPEELDALTSAGARALHEDLHRGWHAKHVLAVHRQARVAKAFEELGPLHHEVLGELTLVVDPVIYEEMCREYGRECWRDRGFRREFAVDNPECAVRSRARRATFQMGDLRFQKGLPRRSAAEAGAGVCTEAKLQRGGAA